MISVEVEDAAWTEALPEAEALTRTAAELALRSALPGEGRDPSDAGGGAAAGKSGGARGGLDPGLRREEREWAVSVLLADDDAVRDLNARFRGKDAATNVLSFPAAPHPGASGAAPHLGDIALAYGVCAREAAEQDKPLANHLQHLVVHGVLHLLGSDHHDDAEAEEMEAAERAILARLGVPDPYAPRDAAPDEA